MSRGVILPVLIGIVFLGSFVFYADAADCNTGCGEQVSPSPPEITLFGQSTMTLVVTDRYFEPGYTLESGTDDPSYNDAVFRVVVSVDPSTGLGSNSAEGQYIITYTAPDDAKGQEVVPKQRVVNVIQDTVKPIITLVGPSEIIHLQNVDYVDDGALVTDNSQKYSGQATIIANTVDISTPGEYIVTFAAPADAAGNIPEEVTRTVTVFPTDGWNFSGKITEVPESLNDFFVVGDPFSIEVVFETPPTLIPTLDQNAATYDYLALRLNVGGIKFFIDDPTPHNQDHSFVLVFPNFDGTDEDKVTFFSDSMKTSDQSFNSRFPLDQTAFLATIKDNDFLTDISLPLSLDTEIYDCDTFANFTLDVGEPFSILVGEIDLITETGCNPPIIELVGRSEITLEVGDTYSELGATATDIEDGPNYQGSVVIGGDIVDTSTVGTYQVKYNAPPDAAGNITEEVTRTVHVIEQYSSWDYIGEITNVPSEFNGLIELGDPVLVNVFFNPSPIDSIPKIIINGASNMDIEQEEPYVEFGAVAIDKNDPTYLESVTVSGEVDTSELGQYFVRYNAPADSGGKIPVQVIRTVNVVPAVGDWHFSGHITSFDAVDPIPPLAVGDPTKLSLFFDPNTSQFPSQDTTSFRKDYPLASAIFESGGLRIEMNGIPHYLNEAYIRLGDSVGCEPCAIVNTVVFRQVSNHDVDELPIFIGDRVFTGARISAHVLNQVDFTAVAPDTSLSVDLDEELYSDTVGASGGLSLTSNSLPCAPTATCKRNSVVFFSLDLLRDSDGDNIQNELDPDPSPSFDFIEGANTESPGSTSGTVISGSEFIKIIENPDGGVKVSASGDASIQACDGAVSMILSDGDKIHIKCEPSSIFPDQQSAIIEIVSGIVETEFVSSTGKTGSTTLYRGDGLTFDVERFIIHPHNDTNLIFLVDEQEIIVDPNTFGTNLNLDFEVKQFEKIHFRTGSFLYEMTPQDDNDIIELTCYDPPTFEQNGCFFLNLFGTAVQLEGTDVIPNDRGSLEFNTLVDDKPSFLPDDLLPVNFDEIFFKDDRTFGKFTMPFSDSQLQANMVLLRDTDNDHIETSIDLEPTQHSNEFSDGTTGGRLSGMQNLRVFPDLFGDGIIVESTGPSTVRACDDTTLAIFKEDLTGDTSEVNIRCGSAIWNVISGTVLIQLFEEGTQGRFMTSQDVVNAPAGSIIKFIQEDFTVSNNGPTEVKLTKKGESFTIMPGEIISEDNSPPEITVPENITAEATSPDGAIVDFEVTATDNIGVAQGPTCSASSGDIFSLGTIEISCNASDAAGNTGTASFDVIIQDTTPPELSLPDDITLDATGITTPVDIGQATATDIVDPNPQVTNDNTLTEFPVGQTTVTWTATDDAGNSATATQTITILSPDRDGDGFNSILSGGLDCNDNDSTVFPGAIEITDGLDNNCNGFVDELVINSDFDDNLDVGSGKVVLITDATVDGNVNVDGGVLIVGDSSTIKGNVEGKNGASISIDNSSVEGNVKVEESESTLDLSNSKVNGNVETKELASLTATGNDINGDIKSEKNNDVTVIDNTVNGNIEIKDTSGSCTDTGNDVNGNDSGCS